MNFKSIQGKTSVKNLESLGFCDGDYVMVIFVVIVFVGCSASCTERLVNNNL